MVIRATIVIVLCIIFSTQSCTTNNDRKGEVFSDVLERKILDYMSSIEKEGRNSKYIYYIWGDSIDKSKFIFLTYGLCYVKNRTYNYTFLDNKLISFNGFYEEFPFEGWVNPNLLMKFRDSIPNSNYQECSSIENFPDFDPKTRQLEIISQDSLRIVGTSMGQHQLFLNEKVRYLQEFGKEKELEELYKKIQLYTIPAVQPVKFVPPTLK